LAAVAAAVLMSAAPATAAGIADIEYDNAVRSFRAGRTSDAYGQFIELASRGDVDAARIALFMHAYGATLYGKHWDAGDQDVAYWKVLVRNSGTSARPVAEFQPTLLTPQKQKPKVASGKGARAASLKNVAVSGN
jgi:hypothetical protein